MVMPGAEEGLLRGKGVIVVTARGGSYGPGTPREGWDYQEPYLAAVLSAIGLADDLHFVHAELTLAQVVPQMATLKPVADKSWCVPTFVDTCLGCELIECSVA
jgi:FMN-dependent NADH-azoreductase